MGKVYFKLNTKTEDPKKDVSIRIRFKDGKIDQATSTGELVILEHWDLKKQEFKRTSFKGKDMLIPRLSKLEGHVLEQAANADQIETGWLNKIVDQHLHPKKYIVIQEQPMIEWIETWISESTNTHNLMCPYFNFKSFEGISLKFTME